MDRNILYLQYQVEMSFLSAVKQVNEFVRFDTICTIKKNVKHPRRIVVFNRAAG